MADTPVRLCGPLLLTTSAVTMYTVPAGTKTILRSLNVINAHGTNPANLTLSIGTNATGTQLFSAYPISNTGLLSWSGFIVLNAGDVVQALSSIANALAITMSGIEVT